MTSVTTDRRFGLNSGVAIKAPCDLATTANITLSGEQSIDGTTTNASRVFVKNQTTTANNGIYRSSTGTWVREPDFNGNRDVVSGTLITVFGGSTLTDTMWRVTNTGTITIGTTGLTFERAAVNDAATVSFLQSGSGAVTRTIQAKGRDLVSVTDFGAVGDGTTDDTAALNLAFAMTGRFVFIPKGTYKITSNLTEPICAGIIGEGENYSILSAATGVTKVLSLGGECNTLRDFQITGNATASAKGLVLGDAQSGAYLVEAVRIKNFTGTTSYGLHVRDALKTRLIKVTVEGCTDNILIQGSVASGFPTTIVFDSLRTGDATGRGCRILNGEGIIFNQAVFESNVGGAVVCAPTGTDYATKIVFHDPWFESNHSGAGNYQVVFDATGTSAAVRFHIRGGHASTSTSSRAINVTGSGVDEFLIDGFFNNQSPGILIQNSARGRIVNLHPDLVYATVISDTTKSGTAPLSGAENDSGPWIAWTPTYSSDIGNAAATFSGAVTTSLARFKTKGKQIHIQLNWSATLLAVTPAYIGVTLPGSLIALNADSYSPCLTKNNAAWEAGSFRGGTADIRQHRLALGTYTSGGAVGGLFTGTIELS